MLGSKNGSRQLINRSFSSYRYLGSSVRPLAYSERVNFSDAIFTAIANRVQLYTTTRMTSLKSHMTKTLYTQESSERTVFEQRLTSLYYQSRQTLCVEINGRVHTKKLSYLANARVQ